MNKCFFGDCRDVLRDLAGKGVKAQTVVTSPPYYALRDYGVDGQLGLEATPDEYLKNMVEVFSLVRDVLADDGTIWVNMGDAYISSGSNWLKPKDMMGMPWRLAFALQADGWYLRQDIIWHKPNPMPESVRDRCTKSHEYIFLLSKSPKYYFDQDSIREQCSENTHPRRKSNGVGFGHGMDMQDRGRGRVKTPDNWDTSKGSGGHGSFHKKGREKGHTDYQHRKIEDPGKGVKNNTSMDAAMAVMPENRNKRSVWTIPSEPFSGAHFATFPQALVEPCVLAGSRTGDLVLDPFFGSGTTGQVAERLGRRWVGVELNEKYGELQRERTSQMGLML